MTTKNLIRKEISKQNPTSGPYDPRVEEVNKKYFKPLNSMSCEKFIDLYPQFATDEIKARITK